jgi:hypothetical protein
MTPKAIVKLLEQNIGLDGTPRELRDAIEQVLLESGLTAAKAVEETDLARQKVSKEIDRITEERTDAGELAIIAIREGSDIVHGSCYTFADDPPDVQQAKLNRTSARDLHGHLKTLSFSQFEKFGQCILRELGCDTSHVTAHSNDQGIDFYGKLTVGGLLKADPAVLKLMHETRVLLVGQAKHYPARTIGPNTIRELVGAMSLSRTRTFSSDAVELFDEVALRPFSPVLALLFSTGDFTKGARHLARRAGLITFSGWQLAIFLADRGVGLMMNDGRLRPSFDPIKFTEWLER